MVQVAYGGEAPVVAGVDGHEQQVRVEDVGAMGSAHDSSVRLGGGRGGLAPVLTGDQAGR